MDGGPDKKVLDCPGKYLPFWDREIELVILSYSETDYCTGLIDVFKRYKVNKFLTLKAQVSSPSYSLLESLVRGSGTKVIFPREGWSSGLVCYLLI